MLRLCRICYKYRGIGRHRLSLVSPQIVSWLSAEHFENSALFEYVLHRPQGNERTGDIRSSWVDVTTEAGPILLRLGRATIWRCFRAILERISSGHRKSRIYPNQKISQKFFT